MYSIRQIVALVHQNQGFNTLKIQLIVFRF